VLHRRGERLEAERVLDDRLGDRVRERLVVGKEMTGPREVALGALVVAAHDGVVGPLEQAQLAVVDELERRLGDPRRQAGHLVARGDGRGG